MGTLIFQQIHYFNKIATWSSLPLTTSNLVKFLWPKCQRDRAAGGGEWRPRRPVGAGPLGMGQPRRGPDRQGRSDARAGGLSGKEGTSCGSTRVAGSGPARHQGQTAQWRPSCCLLFLCPLPQDGGAAAGGDSAGTAERDPPGRSFPQDPPLLREPHR